MGSDMSRENTPGHQSTTTTTTTTRADTITSTQPESTQFPFLNHLSFTKTHLPFKNTHLPFYKPTFVFSQTHICLSKHTFAFYKQTHICLLQINTHLPLKTHICLFKTHICLSKHTFVFLHNHPQHQPLPLSSPHVGGTGWDHHRKLKRH